MTESDLREDCSNASSKSSYSKRGNRVYKKNNSCNQENEINVYQNHDDKLEMFYKHRICDLQDDTSRSFVVSIEVVQAFTGDLSKF